jgi:hypothetical protein
MNGRKAKALRRMAEHITEVKDLPARSTQSMPVGPATSQVRVFNAADTTRGQYRAIKAMVKAAYGRAAA